MSLLSRSAINVWFYFIMSSCFIRKRESDEDGEPVQAWNMSVVTDTPKLQLHSAIIGSFRRFTKMSDVNFYTYISYYGVD